MFLALAYCAILLSVLGTGAAQGTPDAICGNTSVTVTSGGALSAANCPVTLFVSIINAINVRVTFRNASLTMTIMNATNVTMLWEDTPTTFTSGALVPFAPIIQCQDSQNIQIRIRNVSFTSSVNGEVVSIEASSQTDRMLISDVSVVLQHVALPLLSQLLVRIPSSFTNLSILVEDTVIAQGFKQTDVCSLINREVGAAGSSVFGANITFLRSQVNSTCYLRNLNGSFVQGIAALSFNITNNSLLLPTLVTTIRDVLFVVEYCSLQFQYVSPPSNGVVWDVRHRSTMIIISGLQASPSSTWLTGDQVIRFAHSTITSGAKVFAVLVTLEGLVMSMPASMAATAGTVPGVPLHLVIANTSFTAHVEGTLLITGVRSASCLRLDGSFTLQNTYIEITNSTMDLSVQGGNNESQLEIVTAITMSLVDASSANSSMFLFQDTVVRCRLTYGITTPLGSDAYKYFSVMMAGLVASSSLVSQYTNCVVQIQRTQWYGGGHAGVSPSAVALLIVAFTGPFVASANVSDCTVVIEDAQVFSTGIVVTTQSPKTSVIYGFHLTFAALMINTDDLIGAIIGSLQSSSGITRRGTRVSGINVTVRRSVFSTATQQTTTEPLTSYHQAIALGGLFSSCNFTVQECGSPPNPFPVTAFTTPLWGVTLSAAANITNGTSITILKSNSSHGGPMLHVSSELSTFFFSASTATQRMEAGVAITVRDGLWSRPLVESPVLRFGFEVRSTVRLYVGDSVTYVVERNQFDGPGFQKLFSNRSSWFVEATSVRRPAARPVTIGCNIIQQNEVVASTVGSAPRGLVAMNGVGASLNSSYVCVVSPYTATVEYSCTTTGTPATAVHSTSRVAGNRLNATVYISVTVSTDGSVIDVADVTTSTPGADVALVAPCASSVVSRGSSGIDILAVVCLVAVSSPTSHVNVVVSLSPEGITPQCEAYANLDISPPIGRTPAEVAASIGTVTGGAVGALLLPGVAILLQRSMAILALAGCDASIEDPPAASDSPLQLQLGDVASGGYVRGGVVGNVVFLACACTLGMLAGLVATRHERHTQGTGSWITRAARAVGMPALALAPLSLLLQPTVSISILSLGALGGAGDVVLGLLGLAVFLLPCAHLGWMSTARLQCEAVPAVPRGKGHKSKQHSSPIGFHNVMTALVEERVRWVARGRTALVYQAHYGKVFDGYVGGRTWFVWVELGTGVAYGILTGFQPATDAGCNAQLWVNFALSAAILASAALWPYNGLLWNLNYVLNAAVMMAVAVLMVLDDADSSATLAMVAAWVGVGFALCDIFFAVRYLGGVKALFVNVFGTLQQLYGNSLSASIGSLPTVVGSQRQSRVPKRRAQSSMDAAPLMPSLPRGAVEWLAKAAPDARLRALVALACRHGSNHVEKYSAAAPKEPPR